MSSYSFGQTGSTVIDSIKKGQSRRNNSWMPVVANWYGHNIQEIHCRMTGGILAGNVLLKTGKPAMAGGHEEAEPENIFF